MNYGNILNRHRNPCCGYFTYGKFVERVFEPENRKPPALEHPDGVDRVARPHWKDILIQPLNIAGVGPVIVYPFFGGLLVIASIAILVGIASQLNNLDEFSLSDITSNFTKHPAHQCILPMLFVTIVCAGTLAFLLLKRGKSLSQLKGYDADRWDENSTQGPNSPETHHSNTTRPNT